MELERHTRIAPLLLAAAGAAAGCGGDDPAAAEDDLTSVTARERKLTFDGYVYVDADASDFQILSAVRRETKTAFGALRTAEISVNNRELSEGRPRRRCGCVTATPTARSSPRRWRTGARSAEGQAVSNHLGRHGTTPQRVRPRRDL